MVNDNHFLRFSLSARKEARLERFCGLERGSTMDHGKGCVIEEKHFVHTWDFSFRTTLHIWESVHRVGNVFTSNPGPFSLKTKKQKVLKSFHFRSRFFCKAKSFWSLFNDFPWISCALPHKFSLFWLIFRHFLDPKIVRIPVTFSEHYSNSGPELL